MKSQDFPGTVGRLERKAVKWSGEEVASVEYGLSEEGRGKEKYLPVRDTVFHVRVLSPEHFQVLINEERFEDAFSMEHILIALDGAFDHACIETGITSTAAKFKSAGQEENLVRRRHAGPSSAFQKFRSASQEDVVFSKRPTPPSTAFDKFQTAAQEDGVFAKPKPHRSTVFDRFKTAGQEE